MPSKDCPSSAKTGLEERVARNSSKLVTQNCKQIMHPCHYKAHTSDPSKQGSRVRVGVKACQTSAVLIQKQKRHQENLL